VEVATAGAPPRVLLVEDDVSIRDGLFVALTVAGFAVRAIGSGAELADALEEFHPDIVGMDVWLGEELDGFDLADTVISPTGVPVVFLTAADEVAHRLRGFAVGADDYVVKPFSTAEVVARMRAVLRRTGRLVSPTIVLGSLTVDETYRRVQRNREPVELTATEFDLLLALARNPGRTLSKAQLLVQVWGFVADQANVNLVEVYISSLRRKLELSGPRLIFTERGRGYVLRP